MKLQEQKMFYYKTLQLEFLYFDIDTVINIVYVSPMYQYQNWGTLVAVLLHSSCKQRNGQVSQLGQVMTFIIYRVINDEFSGFSINN